MHRRWNENNRGKKARWRRKNKTSTCISLCDTVQGKESRAFERARWPSVKRSNEGKQKRNDKKRERSSIIFIIVHSLLLYTQWKDLKKKTILKMHTPGRAVRSLGELVKFELIKILRTEWKIVNLILSSNLGANLSLILI